jgi:hypothetical protein
MKSLPTGQDSFLGEAFSGSCSLLSPMSVPTWSSDPVAATLMPGTTANIQLHLSHNADATVSIDFVPDPADGGVSPSPGPTSSPMPPPGPIVDGGAHD